MFHYVTIYMIVPLYQIVWSLHFSLLTATDRLKIRYNHFYNLDHKSQKSMAFNVIILYTYVTTRCCLEMSIAELKLESFSQKGITGDWSAKT